ncbi:uncharacterized protein BX663DRAFT_429035 [Cokeromyces recurvatus]|uniref:uncharacterized protein n=1 Tax=Cokeromyces recurvatus TaxID=90255 RepID=UPI0022212490|nr:uncharacterized protein BX663DRAFT_429035 [Cokeromyces recurvatus]KAI7905916.1 hypothetical protein BX663DRAFT_429035 [Cokeromyces recurvatus]
MQFFRLCLNSIVGLHDNQLVKTVGLNVQAIHDLQQKFMINELSFRSIDKEVQQVMKEADKTSIQGEKYNLYVTNSLVFDGDVRKKFEIFASIYKNFVFKKNDISPWKAMSEWGDTQNEKFKVNLRLCIIMNSKYYDLANIQFKRNSGNMKEDESKVLVKGKTILNCLSRYHNLDIYRAKKLKVIVGQFCGNFILYKLKGVFKQIRFGAPSAYMVDKWGKTIKYPINEGMIDTFVDQLQQLFAFKDEVIKQAENLKGRLLEDDSSFGPPLTVEDQSFAKETYYLGRKTKIFPKLKEDIFKQ